jgi:hypothetical protein
MLEAEIELVELLAHLDDCSVINEYSAVKVGQNLSYEDFVSKILTIKIVEKVNELLIVVL